LDILIEKLKTEDEAGFYDFIKRQNEEDLLLFTRWRSYISSESLLKKFIHQECNIDESSGLRLIAKDSDNKICGYGLIDFFKENSKKHVAVVGTMVDNKLRQQGIGKQLLSKEIEICKNFNKKKIRATVHEHNIGSFKLHQSLGFLIEGKFIAEEFYGKYINVLSLALFTEPINM
jgi:L-amino acid N-acyltransferase YncA